ncbi:MAG: 4'-phosphopantetheinyl transferase superfamily protein, partial [Nitrospira sp.]|nr:4'-phosphopantetheinyl transferase superfamily protein [Nitrospira sp.]
DLGQDPTSPLRINPHEIHVWGFVLDISESELTVATQFLSDDEQERIHRLSSDRHRRHRIAAHAGLRLLLGRYSETLSGQLVIQKTPAGKPFLQNRPSVRFNLTHSHGRALIAITKDREVGIDLEKVRPDVDVVRLAQRFLSAQDQLFIERGDQNRRHERFLKAWVAREAVFKAAGTGLTFPLSDDHLELIDDGTAGRLILGRSGEAKPVRFLALEPGWVGAVSSEGNNWTTTYPRWDESDISQGM